MAGAQLAHEYVLHVPLGRNPAELVPEINDKQVVHAQLSDVAGALLKRHQRRRCVTWGEYRHGVRVKGHDHARHTEFTCGIHGLRDQQLVASVHTVKDADSDDGATRLAKRFRHCVEATQNIHGGHSTAYFKSMNDPLEKSGIVVVDKPQGLTSHDVVARLRRFFGTRKVGHAGTLDPMATGVLVAGIERGTKLLAHLVAEDKVYETTIRLGASTTTDDAEGEITETHDASAVTDDAIHEQIALLTGDIMQVPSKVSAIKIDGRRAHELVRAGEEVTIPPRPVTVHAFDVSEIRHHDGVVDIDARVHCSSGTYIRSLGRDLGAALGVGGHLIALRRTSVGPFSIDDAHTLDALEDNAVLSLTMDEALTRSWPVLDVTADEYAALSMGKWLEPRGLKGVHAAVGPDGKAVALVKEQGKRLATVFVARPSTL